MLPRSSISTLDPFDISVTTYLTVVYSMFLASQTVRSDFPIGDFEPIDVHIPSFVTTRSSLFIIDTPHKSDAKVCRFVVPWPMFSQHALMRCVPWLNIAIVVLLSGCPSPKPLYLRKLSNCAAHS